MVDEIETYQFAHQFITAVGCDISLCSSAPPSILDRLKPALSAVTHFRNTPVILTHTYLGHPVPPRGVSLPCVDSVQGRGTAQTPPDSAAGSRPYLPLASAAGCASRMMRPGD